MEQAKYDVFISYSRKDYMDSHKNVIPGNDVQKVKDALTRAGVSYWFDEEDIYSGEDFAEKIVVNIEAACVFVYLSTANANSSLWTSKEIACADEMHKPIIPVRIDRTPFNRKVLFRIADLSHIEYYNNPEKGLEKLIEAIKVHLDQQKNDADDSIIVVDKGPNLKGMEYFEALRTHILNRHTLRIQYKSYRASLPKEFLFFPYLLKEYRHRWYLVGSKPGSKELLNFALDRIVHFEIDAKVPYCDNESVDVQHYFDDLIGVSKSSKSEPEDVFFWISKKRSKYVETKPLHSSQKMIGKTPDGDCVFCIHVVINIELFSLLMSYGSDLIVIKPPKVVNFMRKEFRKAICLYEEEAMAPFFLQK